MENKSEQPDNLAQPGVNVLEQTEATDQATTSQYAQTQPDPSPIASEIADAPTGPNGTGLSAGGFGVESDADIIFYNSLVRLAKWEESSVQPDTGSGVIPKTIGYMPDRIQLTDSIWCFPNKRISKQVYEGEQTSVVLGSRGIAVKMKLFDKNTLREVKMLLKLVPHQNVIRYIEVDFYHHGEIIYLAMELCHEQNLQQYTEGRKKAGKPFDNKVAIQHAKQVVAGLTHIHKFGIIHCDLKPDNILFSLDHENLKISGFGSSREFNEQSVSVSSSELVGTDSYRAPEVITNGRISEKADIFSLGLVMRYIWSYGDLPDGPDPQKWNLCAKMELELDFSSIKLQPTSGAINLLVWMMQCEPEHRPSIKQVEADEIFGGSLKPPSYPSKDASLGVSSNEEENYISASHKIFQPCEDYSTLRSGIHAIDPAQAPAYFAQRVELSEDLLKQLRTTHMVISNAFITDGASSTRERFNVMTTIYCTADGRGVRADLLRADGGVWNKAENITIRGGKALKCRVEQKKIYILGKSFGEDMTGMIFYMMCRNAVNESGKLTSTIVIDDGSSRIAKVADSSIELNRFTMKMNQKVDIEITSGSEVLSEWTYTLESRSLQTEKSIALGSENVKQGIFCSVLKDGLLVSKAKISAKPTRSEESKGTQRVASYMANEIPETALYAELASVQQWKGVLMYVAKSLSSGKEIFSTSKDASAILIGIEPGDVYFVTVHEKVQGSPDLLVAKSEIQTRKTIGREGGTVTVGGCVLKFPNNAIRDKAAIEVCSNLKGAPCLPGGYFRITPVFDFRSTQKIFDEKVLCILRTPYLNAAKPVKVKVLCYENDEWQKVCSSFLTMKKTIEFKCDHFSPYVAVIDTSLSFEEICAQDLTIRMENRIYHDVYENFAGVTCLHNPSIITTCDTLLRDRGYVCSQFVLLPVRMKVGETVKYTMRSLLPPCEIREWEVALDEDFVDIWYYMESFCMDKPAEEIQIVKLELVRVHRQIEKSVTMNHPIVRPVLPIPPSGNLTALNVVQGGQCHITHQGVTASIDGSSS